MRNFYCVLIFVCTLSLKLHSQGSCATAVSVPSSLPFSQKNVSTCGKGNAYSSGTCLTTAAFGGEGFVFKYIPQKNQCINIQTSNQKAGSGSLSNSGLSIFDGCPNSPGVACMGSATGPMVGSTVISSLSVYNIQVSAGKTYYILVSAGTTLGFKQCMTFDIDITECPPVPPPDPFNTACPCLVNKDFEGPPVADIAPPSWAGCGLTPDTQPGIFGVSLAPSSGSSYLGIQQTSPNVFNGAYEGVQQKLCAQLNKGQAYSFDIDLALLDKLPGETWGWDGPTGGFEVWGGNNNCTQTELLWSTTVTAHKKWQTFRVCFTPKNSYNFIILRARYKTKTSNYIGVDNLVCRPMKPNLLLSDTSVCAGECINIKAAVETQACGQSYLYKWDNGLPTGPGPHRICPTATTVYKVILIDSLSGNRLDSGMVTVNIKPFSQCTSVPSIQVNGGNLCFGNCISLTATGSNGTAPYTYTWQPGSLSGASVTVCPVSTTTYTVSMSDGAGGTVSATALVTVNPIPVITAGPSVICAGLSTSLTASGGNTYTWNPGNSSSNPYSVTPATTSSYTVTGSSAAGCTSTAETTVTVNPNPTITATGGLICQGQSTGVSASGATRYVWTPATGLSNPNIANPVASPISTITYSITGTDANGCSNSTTTIVIVEQIPAITASSQRICAGSSVTLNASGAVSYTWLPNNTTGSTLTVSLSSTTTYTITGSTLAGCNNSAIISVTVNPIPVVNFEPDTAGCSPVSVTFINKSTGVIGSTCVWDFGNGKTYTGCQPPRQIYLNNTSFPRSYSVTLTVTSNGCTASLTRPNIITVYPLPKASFTANPWETGIMEPVINFTNTSTGDSIRTWDFGDGSTYTGNNPTHVYEDTGHYNVCLSILNTWGCTDQVCHSVFIKPVWSFYIPNAFTPNGDGRNETFNGKGENIHDYELYIYDRWGNLIFESNSMYKDWDGRANGGSDIAQQDVYVYVVFFKDIFNKMHKLAGSVTLIK